MFQDIQVALWFLLPAAVANAMPIFVAKLPLLRRWNAPLDAGRTFNDKEIFGANKTWRGLVAGMIIATIVFWIQKTLVANTDWAAYAAGPVSYAELPTLLLGPLLGFGALGADALESFFKRLRDIAPGKQWFPFDQLDYIIGAVIVTLPFVHLPLAIYVWIFVIWFVIHLLASYVGWWIGLKKAPI